MKILVIDDNEIDFIVFKRYLSRLDSDVDCAHLSDPRKTIEVLEEQSPDLIVLDINMPFKSGFDVLRDINDTAREPYTVVMMSTSDIEKDREKAQSLGAAGYTTKPTDIEKSPTFYSDFYKRWVRPTLDS